ncbi:hypothetical protein HELRODRAFT_180021 [Helobdella robusta]|uniref:G-protein coupled receptors family 1 profile domain-containing protein n=1 Tax=Helobdella robusta TaxID=6412 RepID=T1FFC9_HELRO|nr:hypothetical protein HELRODRAFT_180021 [Helobdella robusta]ESN94914.1 hypothetical protein HELRODRAFT_180021 [Helobdella robusta]
MAAALFCLNIEHNPTWNVSALKISFYVAKLAKCCKNLQAKTVLCEQIAIASENHSKYDCFVMVLMSHGGQDFIYGVDDKIYLEDPLLPLSENKCKTLIGKSKLFFIQVAFNKKKQIPTFISMLTKRLYFCCTLYKDRTNLPVEISVCLLAGLVLVVVVLYARVYAEVVLCRKRSFMLSKFSTKSSDSGKIMTSSSSFQKQQQQQLRMNVDNTDKPPNEVVCSNDSKRVFNKKEFIGLPKRQKKFSAGQQVQFQLTKHLPQRHYEASSESNYKAFLTTLILAGALLLFWLPYLIISSINTNYATEFLFKLKFFVLDILPMLTYLSDPIIYGVRIRSVRLSYRRVYGPVMMKICCGWRLFCCCNKKDGRRKYVSPKNELNMVNANEMARNGNEISLRMTSMQDLSAGQ